MLRYLILSFFSLAVCPIDAQEVLLEGKVFDGENGKPIPYVNISFINTLKGTSTDEEGHYYIDIAKETLSRDVHVSSLGYRDTIIPGERLYSIKDIRMRPQTFKLDEVVISEPLGNRAVLNPISTYSLTSGFSSGATPWVLALYFPNIGADIKVVDKVTVFLQQNSQFKREKSKFRLRIYTVDPGNGLPGPDLLRQNVILEAPANGDFVTADLSKLQLQIPQTGIYVGLEWLFLPNNWYREIERNSLTGEPAVLDRFAPTFAGIYSKDPNFRSVVFGMGTWRDFQVRSRDRTSNFVPAISLNLLKE